LALGVSCANRPDPEQNDRRAFAGARDSPRNMHTARQREPAYGPFAGQKLMQTDVS
jgi:hypothetical protein